MKAKLSISSVFAIIFFCTEARATNAPSNLVATAVSSSQINLSWTDNSSDEIGFTFAVDTNAAFTNPTYVWTGGVNVTSYSHTGRGAATTYYYKIKAEGSPDSAWTAVASATTAPSGLAASAASESSLNLSWTGNAGNSAVTGYTYAYANNSAFSGATYVWVAGNGSTSATRTGLSTATTYWVKIKAEGTTDALDSPFASAVVATTTPASVAATAASSTQVNVSWTGNASNGNIIGYTVAAATNSAFNGAAYHYVAGAGSTSYSDTGLAAGTTYYYKVKAEGTSDPYDSPFTAAVTATTISAAPNAPSGLSASAISSSQVDLSWTDNSTDETGFEVKRATDSGFTQNVVWIGGIQGTSYSNTGLSASTTYYYKVRAQGATQNSAYSNSVSVTTGTSGTIPTAPSNLSATAVSSTQVNLSWTDNSNNETGFELERATDSAFTQNVVWIGAIPGATYANTGLAPSTTYYYKVRAEGTAGKSAYSAAVSATTGGSAPTIGVPISLHFFGNNAWMPYNIGRKTPIYNGKLSTDPDDPIWTNIQNSGVAIMRYGGHGVDQYANPIYQETMDQYVAMVEAMRAKGIEPVIQVPVLGSTYSASQAADIVRTVNFINGVRASRAVTYWVIGNEPDLPNSGYGTGGYSAHDVAQYVTSFASAMKAADPAIKIIAPETAWYDTNIIHPLTTCDGSGADDVTGSVDYLSFHFYGFDPAQPPNRNTVIGKLTAGGGFDSNLAALKGRLDTCNAFHSRSGSNAVKIAVTEANINWSPNSTSDNLYGVGAKSFLGGQFWAEMMGLAMQRGVDFVTFWSTIEGSGGLSYISSDGATFYPSYYHFQMMAKNLRGNSVTATDNDQANVKEFAALDVDQIAVMIMNEDQMTPFDYTVRLDNGPVSGTRALKINVDAGRAVESTGTIATESSIVLIFNSSGTLTKKIEYKLYGNANNNAAPTVTTY